MQPTKLLQQNTEKLLYTNGLREAVLQDFNYWRSINSKCQSTVDGRSITNTDDFRKTHKFKANNVALLRMIAKMCCCCYLCRFVIYLELIANLYSPMKWYNKKKRKRTKTNLTKKHLNTKLI